MTAEAYETTFRERAERKRTVGVFLFIAAGGIWLWLAYQLFAPFSLGSSSGRTCASRVFYDEGDSGKRGYADAEGDRCAAARDSADLLGMLVVSLPLAAVGLFQYTSGTVSLAMRRHTEELAVLRALPKR
ncbi:MULTISPECIES: hypothetical protein [unclassified Streptomyces]|uniref:Uncharacterized protein n=1 Tax=Streptomyces sp. R33 TaxID=3238629 RepID=A0AB39Y8E2_9ACTN|nr:MULTISPECIES: hypothetical protein [unclassified Streptomyces]KJY40783.1 hypothetical protein VR46_26220 [Streptomyces sp. NRRL S-444]TDU76683.1 hypothetical protein EDD91_3399 [Streptomyces sp. KS 21]THA36762.1 hypothetical protein E6W17_24045 [Streptomyces sp. A1547]